MTFYETGSIRVTSAGIDMPGISIPISAVATITTRRSRVHDRRFWWACVLITVGLLAALFAILAVALDNDPWASLRRALFSAFVLSLAAGMLRHQRTNLVTIHTTAGELAFVTFERVEDARTFHRAVGAAITFANRRGPNVQFGPFNVLQVHARDLQAIRTQRP